MTDLETRILEYLASRHPLEQPATLRDISLQFPLIVASRVSDTLWLLWKSGRIERRLEPIGGRLVTVYEAIRTPTPVDGKTLEEA